jgi:excisionase family DNA binding protein
MVPPKNSRASKEHQVTRRFVPLMAVPDEPGYGWVTARFLRRLVQERRLPFHKPRGRIFIDLNDLDTFVEQGRVEPRGRTHPGPTSIVSPRPRKTPHAVPNEDSSAGDAKALGSSP